MIQARLKWMAFAWALSLPIAASARPAETITLSLDWHGSFCAGLCPDTMLTVSSLGFAEYRIRNWPENPWRQYRYAITSAEFTAFRDALDAMRPTGEAMPDAPCYGPGGELETPRYEALWQDGGPDSHRVACYGSVTFRAAYLAGYRALRIRLEGGPERLTAAEAQYYR
jgi:hypothetical protein